MHKQELIDRCLELPGVYEDYPFDESWTVMRHGGNKKSFALIYEREGHLCANLKCDPMRAAMLRDLHEEIRPGYHMNKEHWNTVIADGALGEEDILDLVRHSFELTRPKIRGKRKPADF